MRTQDNPSIRPFVAVVAFFAVAGLLTLATAPHGSAAPASVVAPIVVQAASQPITTGATATRQPAIAQHAPHTASPSATDTPVPPQPTDTPIPPTPTATPAPSWHTIGTYNGTGPGAVVTLTGLTNSSNNNVRVDYTCQAPGNVMWRIAFQIMSTTANGVGDGVGTGCGGSYALSGSYLLTANPSTGGPDWQITMDDTADAGGPWTATVSAFY